MPRSVMLLRNTSAGATQMLFGLVSGYDAYQTAVEQFGGQLDALYPVSGRFDAVAIVTFPDNGSLIAFALASEAQGQYAETLHVYTRDDLEQAERTHGDVLRALAEESTRNAAAPEPAQGR